MLGKIGPMEIVLILLLVVILFGAKRIPELAKSIGKAQKEYKNAQNDKSPEKPEEEPSTDKDDSKS